MKMSWGRISGLGFAGGLLIGMGVQCLSAGLKVISQDIRRNLEDDTWDTDGPSHGNTPTSDGSESSSSPSSEQVSQSSLITSGSSTASPVSSPATGDEELGAFDSAPGFG